MKAWCSKYCAITAAAAARRRIHLWNFPPKGVLKAVSRLHSRRGRSGQVRKVLHDQYEVGLELWGSSMKCLLPSGRLRSATLRNSLFTRGHLVSAVVFGVGETPKRGEQLRRRFNSASTIGDAFGPHKSELVPISSLLELPGGRLSVLSWPPTGRLLDCRLVLSSNKGGTLYKN